MRNQQNKSKIVINPGLFAACLFAAPLALLGVNLSPFHSQIDEDLINLYRSKSVQNDGASIIGKRLSRKDAAIAKITLLKDLPSKKKDIVLFSNHQMQYIFKGKNYTNLFNMWIGNYSITEIADLVGYLYTNHTDAFPRKILAVAITSPNNDVGNFVVGYANELPNEIVGHAGILPSYKDVVFGSSLPHNLKSIMPNYVLRNMQYSIDYKKLLSFGSSFEIVNSSSVGGDFAIDLNGSSTYAGDGILNINQEKDFSNPKLTLKDISEITKAVLYLDRIALLAGVKLVVCIPPVHESYEPNRLSSNVNKVLDIAISRILDESSTVNFIDDRRNKRYLGIENKKYFYHYDHPSPKYGEELFERISSL